MIKLTFFFVLFLISCTTGSAQLQKFTLNGYVKELYMYYKPTRSIPGINSNHLYSNLIHNRLNFRWYPTGKLTAAIEARNRLFSGQLVREFPQYKDLLNTNPGFFNLATTVISGDAWFLHTMIDRAWIDYYMDNWQFTAGRQRINWGINLVWNPNDIFNTFSYFDFDYEERPGSDALKIKYYTGSTSSAELVYEINRNEADDKTESTIAGKYRFSRFGYDFQFLGGRMPDDIVLGGGWTGDIKGGGFRGEFSWFVPHVSEKESKEAFVTTVSGDYTFKNSLYIHSAILYNSQGTIGKAGARTFFDQNISAKRLSPARYNLFGQLSYPFTPLFTGNVSAILNPSDNSWYLGPMLTCSIDNNLELTITSQMFYGEKETEYGDLGKAFYGRVKWSF